MQANLASQAYNSQKTVKPQAQLETVTTSVRRIERKPSSRIPLSPKFKFSGDEHTFECDTRKTSFKSTHIEAKVDSSLLDLDRVSGRICYVSPSHGKIGGPAAPPKLVSMESINLSLSLHAGRAEVPVRNNKGPAHKPSRYAQQTRCSKQDQNSRSDNIIESLSSIGSPHNELDQILDRNKELEKQKALLAKQKNQLHEENTRLKAEIATLRRESAAAQLRQDQLEEVKFSLSCRIEELQHSLALVEDHCRAKSRQVQGYHFMQHLYRKFKHQSQVNLDKVRALQSTNAKLNRKIDFLNKALNAQQNSSSKAKQSLKIQAFKSKQNQHPTATQGSESRSQMQTPKKSRSLRQQIFFQLSPE